MYVFENIVKKPIQNLIFNARRSNLKSPDILMKK
jgi:hypothetical protein